MDRPNNSEQIKYDTPYMWVVLVVIILANFNEAGIVFGTSSVFAGEYPTVLNRTQTETNIIGSTAIGILLITSPIIDVFCKQFGPRVTAAGGSILMISGVLASSFCVELWHFIVGYSIPCGLGASSMLIASVEIVHHYCRRFKSFGFASIGLGIGTAIFMFPLILSAIKNSGATFQNTCLYLVAFAAVTVTGPVFYRPRPLAKSDRKQKITLASFLKPLKRCHTTVYILQAFLWNSAFIGFLIFLFTEVSSNFDDQIGTTANTIFGSGQLTAAIVLPLIMIKFEPNLSALQIAANLIGGTAMLIFGSFNNIYLYYAAAGVVGVTYGVIISLLPGHAYYLYKQEESNMAYAYQQAIGGVSGIVGPISASYLKDMYGSSAAYYFLGSLALLAGILVGLNGIIRPSTMKPANPPDNLSIEEPIHTSDVKVETDLQAYDNSVCQVEQA